MKGNITELLPLRKTLGRAGQQYKFTQSFPLLFYPLKFVCNTFQSMIRPEAETVCPSCTVEKKKSHWAIP